MPVQPGDILRERFRIDALIGRGGMGHVYAATALDSATRAQVAIKVVSRLLVDDVLMLRLHREAEAATRIQSDFVPRVLEVSDTEDGETFLVMDRLMGEPLSQRIRDQGALPWSEVARVGEDVLRGLIDAHTAGIIHRDLKPSNVFLALKTGRVRAMVLDFGVCKMDGVDTERLTGTGESIGTVAYMAPEQIRGAARVDERADLYAFGVLVFEMLTGRLPHDGPSQMAILASKLENEAARLRDCARVAIPEGADELVARALSRDPADRFASAQELLKAWRRLVAASGLVLAPTTTPPPPRASADDVTAGGDPPTEISRPARSNIDDVDQAETAEDLAALARAAHARPTPSSSQAPSSEAVLAFPPLEAHPTESPLTSEPRAPATFGPVRLALMAGSVVLVVGLLFVAAALARPDPIRATAAPERSRSDPSSAPPTATESAPETAKTAASEESFELLDEPALPSASSAKARPPARKVAPVRAVGTVHANPPRITSQPRY